MSKSQQLIKELLEQTAEELSQLPADLFKAAYKFAYPEEAERIQCEINSKH